MKWRVVISAALTFVHLAGAVAQNTRVLRPVDEAAKDPDFLAFRTRLIDIVARRDTASLLALVHPDIRASFGSHSGIASFVELWKLDKPGSELWKELGAVLKLGGSFDGPTSFTAPYTFSRWPEDVDSFEFLAVTGSNVRLRSRPSLDAPVLDSLSYVIVETDLDAQTKDEWTAVKLGSKRGYISSRYVRSPIDYRATFTYSEGRWRMVFFVAGD